MGIWLELGIFGLVFVFAFWQMHDVRKAQEQTRQQRAREKAAQEARDALDQETAAQQASNPTDKKS
jgi:ABC-type nickel/cobalt efflux system permease component RcnA